MEARGERLYGVGLARNLPRLVILVVSPHVERHFHSRLLGGLHGGFRQRGLRKRHDLLDQLNLSRESIQQFLLSLTGRLLTHRICQRLAGSVRALLCAHHGHEIEVGSIRPFWRHIQARGNRKSLHSKAVHLSPKIGVLVVKQLQTLQKHQLLRLHLLAQGFRGTQVHHADLCLIDICHQCIDCLPVPDARKSFIKDTNSLKDALFIQEWSSLHDSVHPMIVARRNGVKKRLR